MEILATVYKRATDLEKSTKFEGFKRIDFIITY